MTDRQYKDLFQAILDLREATEFGFTNVDRRFNELEERWDRRFRALESRVEDGFHDVCNHFTQVDLRLGTLEDRIGTISSRLRNVEQT